MSSGEIPLRASSRTDHAPAESGSDPLLHGADAVLLELARRGDRRAFGALVERHHATLAAILRPSAGPEAPLDDVLQEVFARALVHVGTFRGESRFVTWAASIGIRVAADLRRREATRRRLTPAAPASPDDAACARSGDGTDRVERSDDADLARRALDRLPVDMRAAVLLRVVDDLDYGEIAERLDAPLPRVRQWVCRGLARLRGDPTLKELCDER